MSVARRGAAPGKTMWYTSLPDDAAQKGRSTVVLKPDSMDPDKQTATATFTYQSYQACAMRNKACLRTIKMQFEPVLISICRFRTWRVQAPCFCGALANASRKISGAVRKNTNETKGSSLRAIGIRDQYAGSHLVMLLGVLHDAVQLFKCILR